MDEAARSSAPRIAVVGGGAGGIALAVKLKKAGIESFTIFEAAEGPGGTWWHNRYPGCEIDSDGSLYSYSFKTYDWSRTHAGAPEILQYIQDTIADHQLAPHFRFRTRVKSVTYDDATGTQTVTTEAGDSEVFDVVVTAVGFLNDPRYPQWPGLGEFRGAAFHSSRWDHSVDLTGKRVAVAGSGSTGTQIVPAVAPVAGHVYAFQRDPGWITKKPVREFTAAERRRQTSPAYRRLRRIKHWLGVLNLYIGKEFYHVGSKKNRQRQAAGLAYIEEMFHDREDLKKAVTPDHPYGGKRQVYNSGYYPALLRDNVELVTSPIVRVTPTGVIDATGMEREVDVLVMATGFRAQDYLSTLVVRGRGGRLLHEEWEDGAYAYAGMQVPGFPNLYFIYGPNTNGAGSYMFCAEQQAGYITRDIERMIRTRAKGFDVRPELTRRYNAWLQKRMVGTSWLEAETHNYYRSPSGSIVTQYPEGPISYWLLMRTRRLASVAVQ